MGGAKILARYDDSLPAVLSFSVPENAVATKVYYQNELGVPDDEVTYYGTKTFPKFTFRYNRSGYDVIINVSRYDGDWSQVDIMVKKPH